jgi:tight adherence protein B
VSRAASIALQIIAALAALAALLATGPASARGAELDIEKAGSAEFPQRAYTLHTPERTALGVEDVTVTENGQPVDALSVESAALAGGSFGTVLVIDASDSMRGDAIEGAIDAARAFADRRAAEQLLGVVTFSSDSQVLLPLTSDDQEIQEALAETPALSRSTHLHDAVAAALGMLDDGDVAAGSVVVLSDGADTGSQATAAQVAEQAGDAGVRVFPVALRSERFDPTSLRGLAVGAQVADATDTDELAVIFDRLGEQLAAEHLIRYESAGGPGQAITVEVNVTGIDGTAVAKYTTPAASAPAKTHDPDESFWGTRAAMLIAVVVAAAMLGLALFVVVRPHRETARERLARFVDPYLGRSDDSTREAEQGHGPLARIERLLEPRDWWPRFKEDLLIADVETPAIKLVAIVALLTGLVALFVVHVLSAAILLPLALLVPLAARSWVNRKVRKQHRVFADQLPDNLQLITSALRAGQSMASAFAVVVEEAPEPAKGEFRRIVNDERLGVPLEDSIRRVARRMDNADLEQVALVATIQRETGGNTAEILDQVIATIRERATLRRLMETLTAQGRLTQIIISVLPIVLLVAITLLNRDYMTPLFETGGGHIALGVGAVLSVIGSLIIKRIVEVRV